MHDSRIQSNHLRRPLSYSRSVCLNVKNIIRLKVSLVSRSVLVGCPKPSRTEPHDPSDRVVHCCCKQAYERTAPLARASGTSVAPSDRRMICTTDARAFATKRVATICGAPFGQFRVAHICSPLSAPGYHSLAANPAALTSVPRPTEVRPNDRSGRWPLDL